MALQHAIDRSQRGNRLDSLLFEFLLDRRGTPVLAALYQRPAQLDDALFNPLRDLTRLVPRLGAQSLCPCRIISLVARFPFNWLQVFRRAEAALLGSDRGQPHQTRAVREEKCVGLRARVGHRYAGDRHVFWSVRC